MQSVVSPAKTSDGGRPNDALVIEMARLGLQAFGMGPLSAGSGAAKPYGTVKWLVQAGWNATNSLSTVSFPKKFPTACIAVVANGNGTCYITAVTQSGFSMSRNGWWIALGY